jgi:hypothetical protein
MYKGDPIRLHLGCGEKYLEGYVNIDYPPAEHTVQQTSVADQYADLLALRYAAGSIAEVRLHHVFEHFSRPIACALLASWHAWLLPAGTLQIEVPDFQKMAKIAVGRWSSEARKSVALRHIFGSQEASWAVHYNGYTPRSLRELVRIFGFKPVRLRKNSWRGTHNIEITARRSRSTPNRMQLREAAKNYLSHSLVDRSASEMRLLEMWLGTYDRQIDATLPALEWE